MHYWNTCITVVKDAWLVLALTGHSLIARQLWHTTATIKMSTVASATSSSERSTYDSEEGSSLQGKINSNYTEYTYMHTYIIPFP